MAKESCAWFSWGGKHLSFCQASDGLAPAAERPSEELYGQYSGAKPSVPLQPGISSLILSPLFDVLAGSQEAACSRILDVAAPSELQGQRHHAFVSNVRHCANAAGGVQPARRGRRGSGPAIWLHP